MSRSNRISTTNIYRWLSEMVSPLKLHVNSNSKSMKSISRSLQKVSIDLSSQYLGIMPRKAMESI